MLDTVADAADNIKICKGRLHHYDVCALFNVKVNFLHRLMGISRIHLICAAVSKLRSRVRCITERAVISRRVLDSVGHDGNIQEFIFVQSFTDSTNTSVHHIRRGDYIGTCLCLTYRDLLQQRKRSIIVYIVTVQLSAVAMGGILTEADVSDNNKLRYRFFYCCNSTLNRTLHIPSGRTDFVLVLRQTKHLNGRNTEVINLLRKLHGFIHRQTAAAGHAWDRLRNIFSRNNKNRINEILYGKAGLTDHGTHAFRNTHTAWT